MAPRLGLDISHVVFSPIFGVIMMIFTQLLIIVNDFLIKII